MFGFIQRLVWSDIFCCGFQCIIEGLTAFKCSYVHIALRIIDEATCFENAEALPFLAIPVEIYRCGILDLCLAKLRAVFW